jgi:hypothetical protein
MIRLFIDRKNEWMIILLHAVLGIVVSYVPVLFVFWTYLLLTSVIWELFRHGNNRGVIHFFLAYYLGMEILSRIAKASPLVPYESGKYFMFVFLLLGILITRSQRTGGVTGWLILLLLFPSYLIVPESITYKDIVFNDLGIINLALAVIYFSRLVLSTNEVLAIIRMILLGIVPVLISVIFKTPDFEDIEFSLAANFATSAGFGSNQVSTMLSLGFLLVAFTLMLNIKLFQARWVSIVFVLALFFRALLTFSRGGLIGGILILILIWLFATITRMNILSKGLTTIRIVVGVVILFVVFYKANQITGNSLLLRYKGETEATLAGRREKDISLLTSNRYDILLSDLAMWKQNLLFGVGPGVSKYAREELPDNKVAAHIEVSRLLAEHGMFGLSVCLILFFYPVYRIIVRSKMPFLKLLQICLFGYALFTTFHSAMRTNVTPYLFGLATISVLNGISKQKKEDHLHRQSASEARS